MRGTPLSVAQVLAWADQHHDRTGDYPNINSGQIPDTNETWGNLDAAMRRGCRGFPKRISLANLLDVERGYRNKKALPHLTISQIVKWADAWKGKFGDYPKRDSGAIPGAPGEASGPIAEGETWMAVDVALRKGLRGLSGGSSLAKLLAEWRGVKNMKSLGRLTINGIWAWMVSHRIRTGDWPTRMSGRIWGTRWETWTGVARALERGGRGLRGGSSLQQLVLERLAGAQGGKEG